MPKKLALVQEPAKKGSNDECRQLVVGLAVRGRRATEGRERCLEKRAGLRTEALTGQGGEAGVLAFPAWARLGCSEQASYAKGTHVLVGHYGCVLDLVEEHPHLVLAPAPPQLLLLGGQAVRAHIAVRQQRVPALGLLAD